MRCFQEATATCGGVVRRSEGADAAVDLGLVASATTRPSRERTAHAQRQSVPETDGGPQSARSALRTSHGGKAAGRRWCGAEARFTWDRSMRFEPESGPSRHGPPSCMDLRHARTSVMHGPPSCMDLRHARTSVMHGPPSPWCPHQRWLGPSLSTLGTAPGYLGPVRLADASAVDPHARGNPVRRANAARMEPGMTSLQHCVAGSLLMGRVLTGGARGSSSAPCAGRQWSHASRNQRGGGGSPRPNSGSACPCSGSGPRAGASTGAHAATGTRLTWPSPPRRDATAATRRAGFTEVQVQPHPIRVRPCGSLHGEGNRGDCRAWAPRQLAGNPGLPGNDLHHRARVHAWTSLPIARETRASSELVTRGPRGRTRRRGCCRARSRCFTARARTRDRTGPSVSQEQSGAIPPPLRSACCAGLTGPKLESHGAEPHSVHRTDSTASWPGTPDLRCHASRPAAMKLLSGDSLRGGPSIASPCDEAVHRAAAQRRARTP
jgi:hypothetical protein